MVESKRNKSRSSCARGKGRCLSRESRRFRCHGQRTCFPRTVIHFSGRKSASAHLQCTLPHVSFDAAPMWSPGSKRNGLTAPTMSVGLGTCLYGDNQPVPRAESADSRRDTLMAYRVLCFEQCDYFDTHKYPIRGQENPFRAVDSISVRA
jgi:hypothetical protein